MAVSTVQANNKLIKFTQEIGREWIKENMFSPYEGESLNSIFRRRLELKAGGEQMNMPLVTRLTGTATSTGTLVGNEEKIDNYGMRVWLEWARHAIVTNKAEQQKDSADIFGEAKPLLSDWMAELRRDEVIAALMALPSESQPAAGVRVNGIQYDLATAAQRNTWNADNSDRVVYGTRAFNATHATALATLVPTTDNLTAANLALLKRKALLASPRIRPFKTKDGYEYFVAFTGANPFRDLKTSLETVNKDARPREQMGANGATNNPIFQDGDQIYDGVIVRQVPEMSSFVTNVWTTLLTAGTTSARVEPVFLCGQQAAAYAIGQMPKPTFRKEDDYGFVTGTGIEAAYGIAKMFKKHPINTAGTKLVQWGVATGFYTAAADA
jgi:N4-gp56 family major capsid protein